MKVQLKQYEAKINELEKDNIVLHRKNLALKSKVNESVASLQYTQNALDLPEDIEKVINSPQMLEELKNVA